MYGEHVTRKKSKCLIKVVLLNQEQTHWRLKNNTVTLGTIRLAVDSSSRLPARIFSSSIDSFLFSYFHFLIFCSFLSLGRHFLRIKRSSARQLTLPNKALSVYRMKNFFFIFFPCFSFFLFLFFLLHGEFTSNEPTTHIFLVLASPEWK